MSDFSSRGSLEALEARWRKLAAGQVCLEEEMIFTQCADELATWRQEQTQTETAGVFIADLHYGFGRHFHAESPRLKADGFNRIIACIHDMTDEPEPVEAVRRPQQEDWQPTRKDEKHDDQAYADAYLEGIQDSIDEGCTLPQIRDSIGALRRRLMRRAPLQDTTDDEKAR